MCLYFMFSGVSDGRFCHFPNERNEESETECRLMTKTDLLLRHVLFDCSQALQAVNKTRAIFLAVSSTS